MPTLELHLTKPEQTVDIGWDGQGFKHLYIVGFRGTGMASGNPTLYLRFEQHQSQMRIYGNCGERYSLMFSDNDSRNGWMGVLGIPITGKHVFNASRALMIKVENHDGTDAQFDTLDVKILGLDTFYQGEAIFPEPYQINFAG